MGWLILILFIIVVLIVWIALIRNARKYRPDFETGSHSETHVENQSSELIEKESTINSDLVQDSALRVVVDTPAQVKLDDLTIIEGIGPKVNKILNESGIMSFADLAKTDPLLLRSILAKARLQYLDPGTWPQQARLASEDKFEELKELQIQLKAGRGN